MTSYKSSYKKDYKTSYKTKVTSSNTSSSSSPSSTLEKVKNEVSNLKNRLSNTTDETGKAIDVNEITDTRNPLEKALNLTQDQNALFDIFEIVGRPQQALFGGINSAISGEDPLEGAYQGLTGNLDTSGGDILRNAFGEDEALFNILGNDVRMSDILGTGLDIALDPADWALLGADDLAKGISKLDDTKIGAKLTDLLQNTSTATKAKEDLKSFDEAIGKLREAGYEGSNLSDMFKETKQSEDIKEGLEDLHKVISDVTTNFDEQRAIREYQANMTISQKINDALGLTSKSYGKNPEFLQTKLSFTDLVFKASIGSVKAGASAAGIALDASARALDHLSETNIRKAGILAGKTEEEIAKDILEQVTNGGIVAKISGISDEVVELFSPLSKYDKSFNAKRHRDVAYTPTAKAQMAVILKSISDDIEAFVAKGITLADGTVIGKDEVSKFVSILKEEPLSRRTNILDLIVNDSVIPYTPEVEKSINELFSIDSTGLIDEESVSVLKGALGNLEDRTVLFSLLDGSEMKDLITGELISKGISFKGDSKELIKSLVEKNLIKVDEVGKITDYGAFSSSLVQYNPLVTATDFSHYKEAIANPEAKQLFDTLIVKYDSIRAIPEEILATKIDEGYLRHQINDKFLDLMYSKPKDMDEVQFKAIIGNYGKFKERQWNGSIDEINNLFRSNFKNDLELTIKNLTEKIKLGTDPNIYKTQKSLEYAEKLLNEVDDLNLFNEGFISNAIGYVEDVPKEISRAMLTRDVFLSEMFKGVMERYNNKKMVEATDELNKKAMKLTPVRNIASTVASRYGLGSETVINDLITKNNENILDLTNKFINTTGFKMDKVFDSLARLNPSKAPELATVRKKLTEAIKNGDADLASDTISSLKRLVSSDKNSILKNVHALEMYKSYLKNPIPDDQLSREMKEAIARVKNLDVKNDTLNSVKNFLDRLSTSAEYNSLNDLIVENKAMKGYRTKTVKDLSASIQDFNTAMTKATDYLKENAKTLNHESMIVIVSGSHAGSSTVSKKRYGDGWKVDDLVRQLNKANNLLLDRPGFEGESETFSSIVTAIKELAGENGVVYLDKRISRYISADMTDLDKSMVEKMFSSANNFFKRNVLLSPGFNFRNIAGIYSNLYLSGCSMTESASLLAKAKSYFDEYPKIISEIADYQVANPGYTADDILKLIGPERAEIKNIVDNFYQSGFSAPIPLDQALKMGLSGDSAVYADFAEQMSKAEQDLFNKFVGKGNNYNEALAKANEVVNKIMTTNMWANEVVDSYGRMAVMLKASDIKTGANYMANLGVMSADEAVRMVMFDPFDLSDFEKNSLRAIFPFYTYAKKNLEYQISNIVRNSKSYYKTYKGLKAMYNLSDLDSDEVANYKVENFYVPIPVGGDGDSYYMLKANLPMSELGEIMSPSGAFNKIISSMNPAIKMIFEIKSNTSLFTGQDIESYKGQLSDRYGKIGVTKKAEYLMSMTGITTPLNFSYDAVDTVWKALTGDENLDLLSPFSSIINQGSKEADQASKEYNELAELQDAVKRYKAKGVTITTTAEIQSRSDKYDSYKAKLKSGS